MKSQIALVALIGLAIPGGTNAKPSSPPPPPPALAGALQAMAPSSAKQPAKPEHDQGDEHASPRAKDVVCNKDTPAAQRSAICPQPNSPN